MSRANSVSSTTSLPYLRPSIMATFFMRAVGMIAIMKSTVSTLILSLSLTKPLNSLANSLRELAAKTARVAFHPWKALPAAFL